MVLCAGDPATLHSAGIRCRIESREVGANLQDHLLALGNVYRSRKPVPPSRLQHSESLMYLHSEDVSRSEGSPDIVLGCVIAPSVAEGLAAPAYARTDAQLDEFIAHAASTHHHPCGTCRMGDDDHAVVDPDLRVKGIDNVFVVDASVFPQIPSGPINAAVVAIAESWAVSAPSLNGGRAIAGRQGCLAGFDG